MLSIGPTGSLEVSARASIQLCPRLSRARGANDPPSSPVTDVAAPLVNERAHASWTAHDLGGTGALARGHVHCYRSFARAWGYLLPER
jgi:hypothetical protein